MPVNKKKNIRLKNRTKYFVPDKDRSHVRFGSPESYQSRQMKIEGYETRLYWQYRYCEDHNGQVFFYTLTYNDEHMPKYLIGYELDKDNVSLDGEYGYKGTKMKLPKKPKYINCFDYEDLVDVIFEGSFRKQLLRQYGTTMKYFVGAELGDGKGSRGLHNNPHYHILFFLEPAKNLYKHKVYEDVADGVYLRNTKNHKKGDTKYKRISRTVVVPYKKITPEEFRHLVRQYWQGFDEDTDGPKDYRTAKYGIAREGENVGLVTDFRAEMYCAKYVTKDVKLKQNECKVERFARIRLRENKYDNDICEKFFKQVIYPIYSRDNGRTMQEVLDHLLPECFDLQRMLLHEGEDFNPNDVDLDGYPAWFVDVPNILRKKKRYWKKFFKFRKEYIEQKVKEIVNEYRNRYCNKCRISQGVGDYALDFITDKLDPVIQVPSKKGFKNRPLSMYYYRKLYTEIVHPVESRCYGMVTENFPPMRVLTDLGIDYKVSRLPQQIKKMAGKTRGYVQLLMEQPELFEKMRESDVNTTVFLHYPEFLRNMNYLLNENKDIDIYEHYAKFKLVYEDRFFSYDPDAGYSDIAFPTLSYPDDYRRFLRPSVFIAHRSDDVLDSFLNGNCKGHLPYSQHPDFLRFLSVFGVFDMCSDYFFVQGDNKKQEQAEELANTKRFHDGEKLKEFYSRFGL